LGFAGIGSELQATSKCIEVNEDELTFEIEIYCGDREICSGTLIRRVVDRLSLSAKIAALSVVDQSFENN
jgi:predicted thioesterase